MGRLPTELVDMIVLKMDDRGTLMDMVSAPAAREIEEKVLRQAREDREEHKRLLSDVHSEYSYICFLYWYDGLHKEKPQMSRVKWIKWIYYGRRRVNRSLNKTHAK